MRFSDLFRTATALYATASLPAFAACMLCDELVTLNADQADCFTSRYAEVAAALAEAPNQRLSINLDSCAEGGGEIALRGGLGTMPKLPANGKSTGKSVYLLDVSGAECLKGLIDSHGSGFDPEATFDLFEQCQP